MRRLGSGPLIANLTLSPLMTVSDHLRSGDYGLTIFVGRIRYADLANVERFHGVTFSDQQLVAAAAGYADRCLILQEAA